MVRIKFLLNFINFYILETDEIKIASERKHYKAIYNFKNIL